MLVLDVGIEIICSIAFTSVLCFVWSCVFSVSCVFVFCVLSVYLSFCCVFGMWNVVLM